MVFPEFGSFIIDDSNERQVLLCVAMITDLHSLKQCDQLLGNGVQDRLKRIRDKSSSSFTATVHGRFID
jgi:hypothetical protein